MATVETTDQAAGREGWDSGSLTEMNATSVYSALHDAFSRSRRSLTVTDMRVLVAVFDAGGRADTRELEEALRFDGAGVRRSMASLRRRGMVTCTNPHGGEVTRGQRAVLILTDAGRARVSAFLRALAEG